jgi:hypothetical protein
LQWINPFAPMSAGDGGRNVITNQSGRTVGFKLISWEW